MAVVKSFEFKGTGFGEEDLEISITEGPVRFTMPFKGTCHLTSTSEVRELAKALNIWADWKDLSDD